MLSLFVEIRSCRYIVGERLAGGVDRRLGIFTEFRQVAQSAGAGLSENIRGRAEVATLLDGGLNWQASF